jgi:hypothetical protein
VRETIREGLKEIEFETLDQKEILSSERFSNYVEGEISNAQKVMQKMLLLKRKDNDNSGFREARMRVYIWNKERIKALERFKIKPPSQTKKKVELEAEIKKLKTFSDVFGRNDCAKHLNVLVNCVPQLLNSNYEFVGNQKTQRGVIAAWFKYLKSKGIIDQSLNRQELASVLSSQIKNYSIAGSSIDNESTLYKRTFEPQFLKLIK